MRIFPFFLLFVFSLAHAEEKRPSLFSLSGSVGSSAYREGALGLKVGLDEKWRVDLSASRSHSGDSQNTVLYSAGTDIQLGSDWNLRFFLIGSHEPHEVSAIGFSSGFTFNLSSLWESELATLVSLDFDRSLYDRGTTAGPFSQAVARLGLEQELSDSLTLALQLESYVYSENDAFVGRAVGRRRAAYGAPGLLTPGLPKSTADLSLQWEVSDQWALLPHIGRVKSLPDDLVTRNLGLGVERKIDDWTLAFDYTHSKTKGYSPTDLFTLGFRLGF